MSIATELQNLMDSFANYSAKVKAILAKKPASVALADSAPTLGGQTPTQMKTTADAYMATHSNNKANPHDLTPDQVNAFPISAIDSSAAACVPAGVIPLSRYGSLDYLPAGVAGSFEGASIVRATGNPNGVNLREMFSMQLEANGNLALLRNGTDGSSQSAYYGYVPDAVNGLTGKKIVMTTRRYLPPFLPAGSSVAYLYQGGQGILAGRFQNAAGTLGDIFITPTKGTLDDSKHATCILLDGPTWDDILNKSEVILANSKVYILYNQYASPSGPTIAEPLDFTLYEIPISALGSGSKVTPTQSAVGQCTGFLGATYSTGKIRLAAVSEAQGTTTPALIQHVNGDQSGWWDGQRHIGGSGRVMTLSIFNADQSKLRVLVYQDPRYSGSGKGLQSNKIAYSFTVNMSDLTVTLDAGQTPVTLSPAGDGTLVYGGSIVGAGNGSFLENYTSVDISYRAYITNNGQIFTSRLPYGPASSESLYRGKWNTFTSAFDVIQGPIVNKAPETREALNVVLGFGSAAGDAFDGLRFLPNNKAVTMTRNNSNSYGMVSFSLRDPGDPLTPNYTYKSITYPSIPGFAPTTDRVDITQASATRTLLTGTIVHADDTGFKAVSGSVLSNSASALSRPVTINDDLTTSGTISATQAALETLRDQIIVLAGHSVSNVIGTSIIDLVIPQDANVPAFASVSYALSPTNERRCAVALVTVNARSGAVTSMVPGTLVASGSVGTATGITGVVFDAMNAYRNLNIGIYETSDAYLIAGGASGQYTYPGGSQMAKYRFGINKSDGSAITGGVTASSAANTGARYSAMPGYGVGDIYLIDSNTKLIFRGFAKTKAQLSTWTYLTTEDQSPVLISQEVAQGWIVYFTEVTPVILGGAYYSLPIGSIDLTTVKPDPSNSTFYLYVNLVDGVASYEITTSYENEDNSSLFIGTIVTGVNSITALNVEKVTKFDNFRISSTPCGSAVPISEGLPTESGSLNPAWFP